MRSLILLAAVFMSGCATVSLAQSNRQYEIEHKPTIATALGVITSRVFIGDGDRKSFEIRTDIGDYYINASGYDSLTLETGMVPNATYAFDAQIYIMTQKEFRSSPVHFSSGEYAKEIYVVVRDDVAEKRISPNSIVCIYAKRSGEIVQRHHLENKLPLDGGTKVVTVLRDMGYVVSVPVDLATAPIFVGVILLGGISAH